MTLCFLGQSLYGICIHTVISKDTRTSTQYQNYKRTPTASARAPNQLPILKLEPVPSSRRGIELASNPLYDFIGRPSKLFSTSESNISAPSSISVLVVAAALLELVADAAVDVGACVLALAQFCWRVDSASFLDMSSGQLL